MPDTYMPRTNTNLKARKPSQAKLCSDAARTRKRHMNDTSAAEMQTRNTALSLRTQNL